MPGVSFRFSSEVLQDHRARTSFCSLAQVLMLQVSHDGLLRMSVSVTRFLAISLLLSLAFLNFELKVWCSFETPLRNKAELLKGNPVRPIRDLPPVQHGSRISLLRALEFDQAGPVLLLTSSCTGLRSIGAWAATLSGYGRDLRPDCL